MTAFVAIMSAFLKIINGLVYLFAMIGDFLESASFMWAQVAILGGFITDLNGSTKKVHYFLHIFGLGSNFWFATGIMFIMYLRKFVWDKNMEELLLLKVEWSFIKTNRLVYRSRVLYFQNCMLLLASIQEILRATESQWFPGMIIFQAGGRTIYTTMGMVICLILISRPVSVLVQYLGRAERRGWYQLYAPAAFLLVHLGTLIWEIVVSVRSGKYLEWNGRFFSWKDAYPAMSPSYVFIRCKDFGFVIVWPVITGLAMCQLSGRKAQVRKVISFILAVSTLGLYTGFAQRADLVTMSAPLVIGNMNIVFAGIISGMSWIPLKLMVRGHYKADKPHLITAILILYILAFLHGVMHMAACTLKLISQLLSSCLKIDDELPVCNPGGDPSAGNYMLIQCQLEGIQNDLSTVLDKLNGNHLSTHTGNTASTAEEQINEETQCGTSTGQKQDNPVGGTCNLEIKKVA